MCTPSTPCFPATSLWSIKAWTGILGKAGLYMSPEFQADLGKLTVLICGVDLFNRSGLTCPVQVL